MGRTRKTDKHLPPRVYYKHSAYWYVDRAGKWNKLGKTLSEALANYGRRIDFSANVMADVFNRYRGEIIPKKAASTQKKEAQYLKRLESVFAPAPLGTIRPVHIYQYLDRRPPVTGNRELSLLSDIMKKAIRWGVLEENPCIGIERNREAPRRRYVSDVEFWGAWELAPPVVQIAMELGLMLGLRPGDLLSLNRQHLTEDGIVVETRKTGEVIKFEWTDELQEVVERAKRLRTVGSFYLLPNRRGQGYTVDGFRQLWGRVMSKYEKSGGTRFQFRDLRAKSGSDHESGEHLGHRDKRTLERVYRRKPRAVKPLRFRKY